jgi:DNA-binding CsgD family transcriptional regulator
VSDPLSDPDIRGDRAPAARSVRSEPEHSERERRVVEGLRGGVAMAEIARQEGISERGLRKYVRTLFARRAPEATGEFIATQMSRLNEALIVSFGAMSAENLPAVDRVVRIVRELDRYQGFGGGARGTATRRKLLESLNSGAETDPCLPLAALDLARAEAVAEGVSADNDLRDPLADLIPDPTALADRLSQGAHGTGMRRNPLESLDSGAATTTTPSSLVREDWSLRRAPRT